MCVCVRAVLFKSIYIMLMLNVDGKKVGYFLITIQTSFKLIIN